jgi:putative FmdB family regulatory protein
VPTYQYTCTQCRESLEAVQSFSDPALTDCPACQGRLRKVFNSVGVVFKGSGFYRTDSRTAAGAAESGTGGDSASETKSDASKTPDGSSGKSGKSDPAKTGADKNGSSGSSSSSSNGSTGGAKTGGAKTGAATGGSAAAKP